MKRLRVILLMVAVLIVCVVAVVIYQGREPCCHGHPLSAWLEVVRTARPSARRVGAGSPPLLWDESKWPTATNAVQQIGTNGIPWLIRWASAHDLKTRLKLIVWLRAHPSLHLRIRSAEERQLAAYYGFSLLGSNASNAWPALVQMTHDPDPNYRRCGMDCLIITKADAATLRPVLLDLVKDPRDKVQRPAAGELHYFFPEDARTAGVYKLFPYLEHRPTIETSNFSAAQFP